MAIEDPGGDGVQIATESFRQLRVVVSDDGVRAGDGCDRSAVVGGSEWDGR